MSMTGRYMRVNRMVIADIQGAPAALLDFLYPEIETEEYFSQCLDIDKSWHAIHILLNGQVWEGEPPLFDVVLGGSQLTDEDLGYGPARFLDLPAVAATALALESIPPKALWDGLGRFSEPYPEIYPDWDILRESKEYILEHYSALRAFFKVASTHQEAVILWLA